MRKILGRFASFGAMVLCVLVGIPVSAFAGDAVTGLVAGIGAGAVTTEGLRAGIDPVTSGSRR